MENQSSFCGGEASRGALRDEEEFVRQTSGARAGHTAACHAHHPGLGEPSRYLPTWVLIFYLNPAIQGQVEPLGSPQVLLLLRLGARVESDPDASGPPPNTDSRGLESTPQHPGWVSR